MNLQQIRVVRELIRLNMNQTQVATALAVSQSCVSKQVIELEAELGFEIFMRRGRRLTGLTTPGRAAYKIMIRLLHEVDDLPAVSRRFSDGTAGQLVLATTHAHARYSLPEVIGQFKKSWPQVNLTLREGTAPQIVRMLTAGEADIGVASEALDGQVGLLAVPWHDWHHVIILPANHPLASARRPTLEQLVAWPLVTYARHVTARSHMNLAFARAGLDADVVLDANDADVIKTYVKLGLGVGIVTSTAYDAQRDAPLVALDARHLFPAGITRIGLRRGTLLRTCAARLIAMLAPQIDVEKIAQQLRCTGEDATSATSTRRNRQAQMAPAAAGHASTCPHVTHFPRTAGHPWPAREPVLAWPSRPANDPDNHRPD